MKSAFTRRSPAPKASLPPPGTRSSAYNQSLLCSTGVASFDEVLGGGLPLGSILLLQQDEQSSYADLVQKLFVAQGLSSPGHHVAVLSSRLEEGGGPEAFLTRLPAAEESPASASQFHGSDEDVPPSQNDPMRIAFRYQNLKAVDSVQEQKPLVSQTVYCSTFDLTRYMPSDRIERKRVHLIDVTPELHASVPLHEHLSELTHLVETKGFSATSSNVAPAGVLRLAIQSYASATWGAQSAQELYRFLLGLRHLLRESLACAVVTMRPSLVDAALVRRLEHASDCVISLQSFAARPDLAELFPRYAGLVHVKTLPALETLVPPSTRLAVMRGTTGKNDLAFRLKRRRFVVETLHLDVDGGINERRTPKKDNQPAASRGAASTTKEAKAYDF